MVSLKELTDNIKNLVTRLYNYYVPPFKVAKVGVSWDWMKSKIDALPERKYWVPLDGYFYTTTLEDFKKVIQWDWTNTKRYISETFDCDDFAGYFKFRISLAFGINAVAYILDYSSGHSYNIIFPVDSDPLIYEPQTDWLIKISERDTKYYGLSSYFIII